MHNPAKVNCVGFSAIQHGFSTENGVDDINRPRTTYPHNRYSSLTHGSGNSGNSVISISQHGRIKYIVFFLINNLL
jgi:hypothetical protein